MDNAVYSPTDKTKNGADFENPINISVITVCYNCVDSIELTMKSVLEQTYDNYEYIVIDGGSADGTTDIINRYAPHLDYYCSERDAGIFDAMNKGAAHAKGDYVVFMNAGDRFADKDVLKRVSESIIEDAADIVYGDTLLDRGDGRLVLKPGLEPANRHRMYFHHQSAYVRRDIQNRIGFDLRFRLGGDFCFFKRCHCEGLSFRHVKDVWTVYDCSGVSSKNRLAVLRENIRIIREYDSLVDCIRFLPRLYFVVLYGSLRKMIRKGKI